MNNLDRYSKLEKNSKLEKKLSFGTNYLNTESSTGPTEYINFI